jgi:hypothetical protein
MCEYPNKVVEIIMKPPMAISITPGSSILVFPENNEENV